MKILHLVCSTVMVCLALRGTPAHALPSGPLYVVDNGGRLGTIDLTTQAVMVIGTTGIGPTDLAFSSNGTLYATNFTSLYQVNRTTAAATLVGNYGAGINGINALIGGPNGNLYAAASNSTTLYSVATSPFAVTALTGTTGGNSAGDLAFGGTSTSLYETQTSGNLYRIAVSGSAITSTLVGNTGRTDVYGLATGDDGVTYALAGTEVYSVNTTTAVLRFPCSITAGTALRPRSGAHSSRKAALCPSPPRSPCSASACLAWAWSGTTGALRPGLLPRGVSRDWGDGDGSDMTGLAAAGREIMEPITKRGQPGWPVAARLVRQTSSFLPRPVRPWTAAGTPAIEPITNLGQLVRRQPAGAVRQTRALLTVGL